MIGFIYNLGLIAVGFVLLVVAADKLVEVASRIARRLGVPDLVIGLTIVSIGTTTPEVVVSVTSALSGSPDMAVGNALGSCSFNMMFILGVAAIIHPVKLSRSLLRTDMPLYFVALALLAFLVNLRGGLGTTEGIILLAGYVAFLVVTGIRGAREGAAETSESGEVALGGGGEPGERGAWGARDMAVDIVVLAVCVVALRFGAGFAVDGARTIAQTLGISERIIGLTVVSLGTSLPELVTSIVAASKGNTDLALGNVIGANVSNILLVLGASASFAATPFDPAYNVDNVILLVIALILVAFALTGRRNTMTRVNGVTFVALYGAYIAAAILL